ncbi:hypothetical protein BC834DRAFT_994097 [Gloeopeniophorella convolvens]|nr:hypothetical protein BC834DRAFT_994097 [Gloeopeniophorella convolvens]
MSDVPQSDVSRPSKLPTASLLPQRGTVLAIDQTSAGYLDSVEEEWNKRVDIEIETLADGMVDLVNLASIGDKDKFKIAQETFQAQFRAESMSFLQIRAANSLLSIVHSMKLQLLLSDEAQIVGRRDAELTTTLQEKEEAKTKVAELLNELLQRPKDTSGGSMAS